MIRRPPRSTRPDTLFPYTTLFRSQQGMGVGIVAEAQAALQVAFGLAPQLPVQAQHAQRGQQAGVGRTLLQPAFGLGQRSEEHTSELQSLMRISYAVFCLKKKNNKQTQHRTK